MLQLNPTTPTLRPRSRVPWRGLLMVGGLLLVARVFLYESLRVASGSMEPCLHGDPQHGDTIAILRHWWKLAPPERFDLVVFARSPDETRAGDEIVVKRVAALGGESVRIADGELWVREAGGTERRIVKRYHDFHSLLVPLWREPFDGAVLERLLPTSSDLVTSAGRALRLDGREAGASCRVRLASGFARYDDGWLAADGTRVEGRSEVADLLFAVEVALEDETAAVALHVRLGGTACAFVATPVGGEYRLTFDADGEGRLQGNAGTVSNGRTQRFEFFLIDGRVGAAIDGDVAFEAIFDRGRDVLLASHAIGAPELELRNGRGRLTAFEIWRDLHFTRPADAHYGLDEAFEVPEGALFVLGDASDQSIDSRYYGAITRSQLRGRPLATIAPARRRRWLW